MTRGQCLLLKMVLTGVMSSLCAVSLGAQPQTTGALAGRDAQYVFVIDDSGSMRGEQVAVAADQDRLAVFAIRSVLAMLNDTDAASVVRLNGEPGQAPPIELLSTNRQVLEQILDLDGPLAAYEGNTTPCRSALEETARLLNRAHRPGVPQVVMFLTDGACTPRAEQRPDPQHFLEQVRSAGDGLFRFYFLYFTGNPYTPQLAELARRSGGQVLEVTAKEAASIVEPFADALTRSQGYEAEVLGPGSPVLPSYQGARRVRLLAVAPGEGEPLKISVAGEEGGRVRQRNARTGLHRFPGRRPYRYATVEYRPGEEPVQVKVAGGGGDWRVVAVPEYRLRPDLQLQQGECGDTGPSVHHQVAAGSPLCVTVRLVNEAGQPLSSSLGEGRVEARVLYWRGSMETEPQVLPATRATRGEGAVFQLQRASLESGDHVFQPVIQLPARDRKKNPELRGAPVSVQAASLRIAVRPGALDLGNVLPGDEQGRTVTLEGNFPASPAQFEVTRGELPSCITFTFGGVLEGQQVELSQGQEYSLLARVAPFCGVDSFDQRFDVHLRLSLGPGRGVPLAAVEVPVSFRVPYHLELPPDGLRVALKAGESRRVALPLRGNATRPLAMEVLLPEAGERRHWPREDHLEVGFAADDEQHFVETPDGHRALAHRGTFGERGGGAPELLLASDLCCGSGSYRLPVALRPVAEESYAGDPPVVFLPLEVEVQGAGSLACWGPWIRAGLLVLLLVALVVYAYLIWRNSSWLRPDTVARQLVPLQWTAYGDTERDGKTSRVVRKMVRKGMPWHQRAWAWLRANPLTFPLPGRSYQETLELHLQPEAMGLIRGSSVKVVSEPRLMERLQQDPGSRSGRLYASAQGSGSVVFFGVPWKGRLGFLKPQRLDTGGYGKDESESRLYRLRRKEKLIQPRPPAERDEGTGAGWQVG